MRNFPLYQVSLRGSRRGRLVDPSCTITFTMQPTSPCRRWISPKIQFISGLPRSGSTMLAAILRQNPEFHAAMSGPVFGIVSGMLKSMSPRSENGGFISDCQRERLLHSAFESFYEDLAERTLIFDTNRAWCGHMSLLTTLFPSARVICCVRSPAWIVDSIERRVQAAAFPGEKMFPSDSADSVYTRAEYLLKKGMLALPLQVLRQAWYGEHAGSLIAIRYESLTERPAEVIQQLYALLGQPLFPHDFENLQYDEPEFDEKLGMPGLHQVRRRVEPNNRTTILPPDLFSQNDRCFWDVPGQNPRGVTVL
jgi:sulfotransferase